ncbi:hypothetical protein [Paractinoplanes hotanensis]|uniref:Uncharacterized protein n=1 Tax=Paractinoplanes hotanensis TaxID=2906497 RepID=A0ABT0XTC9_9ACTN|nr:hypothetical protein [Actinoplanes hotanensis]MCM4077032.1 hypothetical protein [Actinoplanes hotanensis]
MTDPVLTSSYCTAWDSFNTPRIWSMVMNEDDALAREQVLGWRRLASSIRSQHQALSTAKTDLMAAWPPDRNASAEAFLNELDRLMVRLEAASADADTTANGLDRILNALDGAKKGVEPLWEKYKDKSDDLVPRWFDSAEDEIDVEARNHMIAMERAVSDAVADLRVPDPFQFTVEAPREWPPRPESGEPGSGRLGSGGISTSVPHDPVPPLPGLDPIAPDASGPGGGSAGPGAVLRPGGPDLAGVINPPLPGLGEGGGVGPVPGGAPAPATPPPLAGVPGVLPGGGPVVGGGARRPPIGAPGRGPVAGRTLPSGAVIGGPGSIGGPAGRGSGSPGPAGGRAVGGPGIGGPGSVAGRGGVGGVGSPGAAGGRGGGRPGVGSFEGEPGRGGVGRGAGGPQLNGVGGPGAGLGRGAAGGLRGPGAARGRAGSRRGSGDIRSDGASVDGFAGGAGAGGVGGPLAGPAGGGRGGGGRGPARAPRPAWLPDDPVGPDRHLASAGPGGRGQTRSRGDEPTGFDPDNLWRVAEGVTPVISPGIDDDWHDPGPNVIGRRG